jgi:hypothetical protein
VIPPLVARGCLQIDGCPELDAGHERIVERIRNDGDDLLPHAVD